MTRDLISTDRWMLYLHAWNGVSGWYRRALPLNLGRVTGLTLGWVTLAYTEPSPDDGRTAIETWRCEARQRGTDAAT